MSISGDSQKSSPQTYEPVVPTDLTRGSYHSAMGPPPQQTVQETRSSSDSGASLKSPRTARFAEATTIHSPLEQTNRSPFADPTKNQSSGGVGDLGFGYVTANDPAQHAQDSMPPVSPLRSGLRVPNTARSLNPLSPTFREEYMLGKQEKHAEKENARDLVRTHYQLLTSNANRSFFPQRIKLRVRIAKIFLRFVNFGCSLIVLSLLAVTLTVFNATKSLPLRSSLPAWAEGTNPWAQYLLLAMACVSLFACVIVFWAYWKGGHRRAEKTAVYYTAFSIGFFFFSLVMWIVGAAIYHHSKASGNSKDMWGWSCKQNTREQIYHDVIDYALLCRLQVSDQSRNTPFTPSQTDPQTGLGPRLRHHRSRHRSPRPSNLHRRLLPLLDQTPPHEIHGPPRQSPLRPLPRPAAPAIRTQHPRLPRLRVLPAQIALLRRRTRGPLLCRRERRGRAHKDAIRFSPLAHATCPVFPAPGPAHQGPAADASNGPRGIQGLASSCILALAFSTAAKRLSAYGCCTG